MTKMKLIVLLIVSSMILLFASCGGMAVDSAEDISIDLSSVVSRGVSDWAKVSLVAKGANNFQQLPEDQALQRVIDGKITLTNIPVATYTIYISVGSYNTATEVFTAVKAINGQVSVTGGDANEAELIAEDVKTTSLLAAANVKGAAYNGSEVFTIVGNELYKGISSLAKVGTTPDGFTLNNVTAGYQDRIIISAANSDGRGFAAYDAGSVDWNYAGDPNADPAEGLIAAIESDTKAIDIVSTDVFWEDDEEMEIVFGQTEGGLAFSIQDFTTGEEVQDWMALDLGVFMEDAGLELEGKLINGITLVKKYDSTTGDMNAIWVYMASQAGDFRIIIPLNGDGFDVEGEDAVMDLFEPFKEGNALAERKVLDIKLAGGDDLFVATDSGLYTATAAVEFVNMNAEAVTETAGKRIIKLAVGDEYTACVTALNLYVVKNDENADGSRDVEAIAFNEGLPVSGLMSGDTVSGLAWNNTDNVLYVAGNNGLVSLDADELFE